MVARLAATGAAENHQGDPAGAGQLVWGLELRSSQYSKRSWELSSPSTTTCLVPVFNAIAAALDVVKGVWDRIWNAIKLLWEGYLKAVVTVYNNVLVPLWNGLTAALDTVKGVWDTIWGAIAGSLDTVLRPVQWAIDKVVSAIDAIKSGLKSLKSFLSSFKLPSINLPSLPSIPGFASGVQNFSGGLALVGERGPELVNLPRGSDVIPSVGGGSMGGGDTYVFNFPNYLGDKRELKEAINETRLEFGRRGN